MILFRRNMIWVALILIGVSFLVLGVWQEETEQIFRKAVNICMECIGLG